MNKFKKILTLEDLVQFCMESKIYGFNAKETGYQLSVQSPAFFQSATIEEDDTTLYAFVRLFHIGLNRNGSSVTEEAAKRSLSGIKYKPVLANFTTNTSDGLEDFTSHDMEFDDEGNVIYLERQVGCFTADEPYIATDEETGKDFVYAKVAIPREYTSTADIIERKNGTKISVELIVNEMQFNAKEKFLELTDIIVQGATLLGTNPVTGKQVEEGMKNAKVSLTDFSVNNNSLFSNAEINEKLVDTLEKLNATLESFNINNTERKEAIDVDMEKFEEEVTETVEEEVTETSTVEEVTETEEMSEETVDETPEETVEEIVEKMSEETEEEIDEECIEQQNDFSKKYSVEFNQKIFLYEISLDEKIYALEDLINATYSDQDNAYYCVKAYEDYLIMIDYWSGKAYKQSYKEEDSVFSLLGDRIEVYSTWLTKEEESKLDEMRSNYSAIQTELDAYKKAELDAAKDAVFADENYASFLETKEFKELISHKDDYSLEELKDKAELAFAKCVKQNKTFSLNEENRKIAKHTFANPAKVIEKKPYGTLFD